MTAMQLSSTNKSASQSEMPNTRMPYKVRYVRKALEVCHNSGEAAVAYESSSSAVQPL